MGQRPCSGGFLQEPPGASRASVEEAVREAVVGFRMGRRSRPRDACCVRGAVVRRPHLPGATVGCEPFVASEAAAAKRVAAEHARLPRIKFTVIESQKTLAGKRRRVRRPHESLDARVAAVSSSLYVCCMTREGWIRTELNWTRTGLDGGQSSEGFGGGVGEGDYFSFDSIKPCGACRWTPSSTGS